jgi:hypothetical protein
MKLSKWFIGLIFAAVFLANPVRLLADNEATETWYFVADDEDPGIQASTDYCYAGTIIDPATGESVDLYNLCTDSLDFA